MPNTKNPASPDDPLVLMGVFGAPHGLRGEIRLKSFTADPESIADYGPLVAKDGRSFTLTHVRPANEVVIARVKGVSDRDGAAKLTNLELFALRSALGDPEDEEEFFHADLVGLRVENPAGDQLGTVDAILNFGAGDMVDVRPLSGGKTVSYPFTKKIVPVVDLAGGRIVIDPPAEIDGDER